MDIIEFFFGATKEEPKPKPKAKGKIKIESEPQSKPKRQRKNLRDKRRYTKADLSGLRRRSKTEEGETNAD